MQVDLSSVIAKGTEKMNGIQNRKNQRMVKQSPGCLGRMVNLFDLHNGVASNRLLTDTPLRDGFPSAKSRSDVVRMSSATFGDQIEDKMIVSELNRSPLNREGNGTPMKTLIAHEMSKEIEPKNNPPNLVAKLMGLDTLPHQQTNSTAQRSLSKGYSRRSLSCSGIPMERWELDDGFLDKQMLSKGHRSQEHNEYRDAYEIWHQSERMNKMHSSPQKGGHNGSTIDIKMALVRQKFTEAKRLATDENGCQSKEFIDAIEVLSSNRDIFLKFLQESNSMFSYHLNDMRSAISPTPETKCITVLRPSKMVDSGKVPASGNMTERQTEKPKPMGQATGWDRSIPGYTPSFTNQRVDFYHPQPTRIVVLKPTPGKVCNAKAVVSPLPSPPDTKAVVSPLPSPPRIVRGEDLFDESEGDEASESREVMSEISRQTSENLMGHRRVETLLSSVFSNGYIGDDSSFVKSENDCVAGNLSDSEIMSPASRHSWDYMNKLDSPYSTSSFSRASFSPESSVCREAKKRLSERWAMMKSNASSQEQKDSRKSSSTLGEMLALSDPNKSERSEGVGFHREQETKVLPSCLSVSVDEEDDVIQSPNGLSRSKSLPASSTVYVSSMNVLVPDPEAGKQEVAKELTKAKSIKSSLKGKVSSLFFSRNNKKTSKEKSGASHSICESRMASPETDASSVAPPEKNADDASAFISNNGIEVCSSSALHGSSLKDTNPDVNSVEAGQAVIACKEVLSVAKPVMPESRNESQDQPSPVSVLEPPFDEDDGSIPEPSGSTMPHCWGPEVASKFNLIGKSPPIESIARTLSLVDSLVEAGTQSLKPSPISTGPEEDEQDWHFFIQSLLSEAGLDPNLQPKSFFAKWHSSESPLDPLLRDKYANLEGKDLLLQEAKRRQRRSFRKLVFDSVNAALKTSNNSFDNITRANACIGSPQMYTDVASPMLVNFLWAQMKEWFVGEVSWINGDCGNSNSLVVERVVRKEVVGKGWVDKMAVELDNLGKEMEGKLLEELVEETAVYLTGRV